VNLGEKIYNEEFYDFFFPRHKFCDQTREDKMDSGISYRKIQQDTTVCQNLLFHIYRKLNMFRATHRPSSGA